MMGGSRIILQTVKMLKERKEVHVPRYNSKRP